MGADGEKGRVLTGPLDRALNVVELGLESMTRDVGARARVDAASAPSGRNRSPEKMTAGQARLHQRLSWIRAKKLNEAMTRSRKDAVLRAVANPIFSPARGESSEVHPTACRQAGLTA